jgi:hypothetical protein
VLRRLIWFVLGAAVGIFLIRKIRGYLAKSRPEAIAGRVRQGLGERAGGISAAATDFVDRARAAMAEREEEILDALGRNQPTDDNPER